jgi:hypothetical protein
MKRKKLNHKEENYKKKRIKNSTKGNWQAHFCNISEYCAFKFK